MIEEAQVAFHQHDPYKLFRVINQRCPKQKSKRIHLKSPAGDFYSPPVLAQVVQVIVKRRWGACSNRCLRDSPRPVPGWSASQPEKVCLSLSAPFVQQLLTCKNSVYTGDCGLLLLRGRVADLQEQCLHRRLRFTAPTWKSTGVALNLCLQLLRLAWPGMRTFTSTSWALCDIRLDGEAAIESADVGTCFEPGDWIVESSWIGQQWKGHFSN